MKTNEETGYYTKVHGTEVIKDQKNQWVYVERKATVPQEIDKINLRIETHGGNAGDAWFDDLKIEKNNVTKTVIVEENNYYPFGLQHKGYNNVITSTNPAQNYMYNQGTSGTNFQGKEGKSFKVERQEELGLNVDMTKFRMYDYALGRFTSIDPLADANPQESWTPYQYAYNNPIRYNDPYGDCPQCIWGAIIGAAVDYGLQVAGNLVEGKDLGDALTDVDGTSILLSAGAGALSGGISSISKLQKAGKVVNTAVNVATDTGVSVTTQAIKDGEVSLKKTLIDVGAGQIVGNAAGNKVGKSAANSAKGKNLQTKINQQKNIARGKSNKTPKSKANVNKAQTKLDTHVGTRAAASSTTASGAASTAVEKIEKKIDERNN
jgi:RHS repeat-associated protein